MFSDELLERIFCDERMKDIPLCIQSTVTDNLTRTVYLSNLLHGRFLDKVISHELCHVWCFMNNIYMPIEVEEQVADFLATYGRDIFDMADFILSNLTENEIYA